MKASIAVELTNNFVDGKITAFEMVKTIANLKTLPNEISIINEELEKHIQLLEDNKLS